MTEGTDPWLFFFFFKQVRANGGEKKKIVGFFFFFFFFLKLNNYGCRKIKLTWLGQGNLQNLLQWSLISFLVAIKAAVVHNYSSIC